jgi:hypothetical protein
MSVAFGQDLEPLDVGPGLDHADLLDRNCRLRSPPHSKKVTYMQK